MTPNPIATAPASAAFVRSSRIARLQPTDPLSSRKSSTKRGAHRAGRRQTQALQAHRPSLREDWRNYGSFVALALGLILIKSVHTA